MREVRTWIPQHAWHKDKRSWFVFSASLFFLFSSSIPITTTHTTNSPTLTQPQTITMADTTGKLKSTLRAKFDKLTPEDFQSVSGNKDGLVDKVAEKYSISKDEAKKQVDEAFAAAQ